MGGGFRSINVALRQKYDLYANIRPAKTWKGAQTKFDNVDIVVVRENTEGLYLGLEHFLTREKGKPDISTQRDIFIKFTYDLFTVGFKVNIV